MGDADPWQLILERLRIGVAPDDFRRWFLETSYASDSGDQITVWVPTESARRHITAHYGEQISSALAAMDRGGTRIRFVVAGLADDEEEEEST